MKFLAHNEDNPAEAPGISLFHTCWAGSTKKQKIRKIQITGVCDTWVIVTHVPVILLYPEKHFPFLL